MSGWPLVALGDIFAIARGGSPRPIQNFITDDPGGVNWIMISDATEKYISSTKKRILKTGVKRSRMVHPGDFLLTNSMSFGRPYIMKISGCIHDGWLVFSNRQNNVDSDYFYHLLGSDVVYSEFARRAAGATVKNLNIDLVKGVKILLPPLAEQRRIAKVLDLAQTLRAKRRAALAQLDTLTQALFFDLFGDPGVNPKDWPIRTLGELGAGKGSIVDGPFGSAINVKEDYIEDGEIPVIRTKNVRPFQFIFEDLKLISRAKFQELERSSVIPGDIILTKVGTIGNVCFFPAEFAVGVLSTTGSCRIRPNERIVRSIYLGHFLHGYRSEMMKLVAEGVQPFLNMSHIKSFKVFVPPLKLQDEFARRVSAVNKVRAVHRASLANFDSLFAVIQQRAFNGELFSDKRSMSLVA